MQPLHLLIADSRRRVRHVVQNDEMHAAMIERVVRWSEEFAERFAAIERGIMLTGHQPHRAHFEAGDLIAELGHSPPPFSAVFGRVREVAREHDEVGRFRQRVDGGYGLAERAARIGIDRRTLEAPMNVGKLNEIELRRWRRARRGAGAEVGATGETRGVHHTSEPSQLHELSTIDRLRHGVLLEWVAGGGSAWQRRWQPVERGGDASELPNAMPRDPSLQYRGSARFIPEAESSRGVDRTRQTEGRTGILAGAGQSRMRGRKNRACRHSVGLLHRPM